MNWQHTFFFENRPIDFLELDVNLGVTDRLEFLDDHFLQGCWVFLENPWVIKQIVHRQDKMVPYALLNVSRCDKQIRSKQYKDPNHCW